MRIVPLLIAATTIASPLWAEDDLETLMNKTASVDPEVRDPAVTAVAALGERAVPAVLEALQSDDLFQFLGAGGVILEMEKPPAAALPLLRKDLEGDNLLRTRGAIYILKAYGPDARDFVPGLLKAVGHENLHIRYAACRTLATIGPGARAAVPELLNRLQTDAASVRGNAALALGSIGVVEGHDVVAALLEATSDRTDSVRERSLMGLGRLGPAAKDVAPDLRKRMTDSEARNRVPAAMALWRITESPDDSVEVLTALVDDIDLSFDAVEALGEMGPEAKAAVPRLEACLESEDSDLKSTALRSLAVIAPEATRPKLERLAESDDKLVRRTARQLLGIEEPEKPVEKEDEEFPPKDDATDSQSE